MKRIILRPIAAFALTGAVLLASSCVTPITLPSTPDLGSIPSGSYDGSYEGSMVKASVRTTMDAGRILGISITEHTGSSIGRKGEAVKDRVIAAQSLEVEVVSGATHSSSVILKAIEDSLLSGLASGR